MKLAISFGDTRRMLLRIGKQGVKIERKVPNFISNVSPGSAFSPYTKKIYIPREKDIEDIKEFLYPKGYSPRMDLMHEGSHAIVLRKYLTKDNKKIFKRDVARATNLPKLLKEERLANRTALQNITNKKDRETYIELRKPGYQSYKSLIIQRKFSQLGEKYKNDPKMKKIIEKLNSSKNINEMKNIQKNLINTSKKIFKNDSQVVSSIAPSFKKKNYIV